MRRGKGKRKLLRGLVITIAALAVLWVALPLWFPWGLRPIAQALGAHYGHYERNGYPRFTVEQVRFTNRDAKVHAERLQGVVPSIWLWRLLMHPKGWTPSEPFVRANGWRYEAIPSGKPGRGSTYADAQDASRIIATVARWVPSALLTNGTVFVEKAIIDIPVAIWGAKQVWAEVGLPQLAQTGTVTADLLQ